MKNIKEIYLAGGCFWGVEHYFKMLNGVTDTEVGYANSVKDNPSYREVCSGTTHAAETVRVRYDSSVICLESILDMFFHAIDPLSLNKQGNDMGEQYRTGIYYTDPTDLPVINKVFSEQQKKFKSEMMVELLPLQNFFTAEDFHQDYLDKNPSGYCHLSRELFEFVKNANCKSK